MEHIEAGIAVPAAKAEWLKWGNYRITGQRHRMKRAALDASESDYRPSSPIAPA